MAEIVSSDSPSRPTTNNPSFFAASIVRAKFVTCAIGKRAAAPADAFQAEAVIAAARRSVIKTPAAPKAAALLTMAPKLRGSVTPSSATINAGYFARCIISSKDEYWKGLIARIIPWLLGEIPSTSARCASRIGRPKCNASLRDSATRSSTSILRATNNSVAGTASRKASKTALRPATISPRGRSPRGARDGAERVKVVARGLVLRVAFFSAAFLRLAAA